MKPAPLLFATLFAILPATLPGTARADEAAGARLTIGDDLYRVPIGKPFAVLIDGERVTMKIEVDQTKAFAEAGVGFRYPAEFQTRRDDGDENVAVWTIEGRSAAIVVQKYRDTLDAASLAEAIAATIVERYGEERVERTTVKLRGADRSYDGERLTIAAARDERVPTETEQNLFAFENEQGVFTLIVQDSRRPGDGSSDEFKRIVRLLSESFDGGEPPAPEAPPADEPDGEADR